MLGAQVTTRIPELERKEANLLELVGGIPHIDTISDIFTGNLIGACEKVQFFHPIQSGSL